MVAVERWEALAFEPLVEIWRQEVMVAEAVILLPAVASVP
jgi:hypothetical protein